MPKDPKAARIIKELEDNNFYTECPCGCGEVIPLRDSGLFYLDEFNPEAKEAYEEWRSDLTEREKKLREDRKKLPERVRGTTKSVNIGFIFERIAPALKSFSFDRNDCRSLFDPIDYIIFEGLTVKDSVDRIIFSDIKTGGARLAKGQKEIKELVEKKKVEFDVYERKGKS